MRISASGGDTHNGPGSALHLEGSFERPDAGPQQATTKPPALGLNPSWALYHTNREAWAATKELLWRARESIALEQFIFSHRGIGRELLEILTYKARRGIDVRVLADAFGSPHLLKSEGGKALMDAGGEIVMFNPLSNWFRKPASHFHRLHRKAVVCDARYLMTGGSCFHPRMEEWRDTVVIIEDEPVAAQALAAFEATWRKAGGTPSQVNRARLPVDYPPGDWSYVVSSPDGPQKREYYDELLGRIDRAQRIVTLTTPYLVPVGRFWSTMERASRRGVRVRVMIPKRSDHRLVDLFSLSFARKLLGRGIEVYGFARGMMHAKLAAIDDDWAAVGSFNLGIDSIRMNLEGALVSRSRDFHDALVQQLELDLSQSRRL